MMYVLVFLLRNASRATAESRVLARGDRRSANIEVGMVTRPSVPGKCRKRLRAAGALRGTVRRDGVRLSRLIYMVESACKKWYERA